MDTLNNELCSHNINDIICECIESQNIKQHIDTCCIHDEEYAVICECDKMYCKYCDTLCDKPHSIYTIGSWKKHILQQMGNFRYKLTNKITGLNCIIEIVNDSSSIIKQYEDIIDNI